MYRVKCKQWDISTVPLAFVCEKKSVL